MPEYMSPETLRVVRNEALIQAINAVQHFNRWDADTVLKVAGRFEKFILDGTIKESE